MPRIKLTNSGNRRTIASALRPIELTSNKFIDQKLAYIHENPVKAGLVDKPWEYRYSSARDYMSNQKGLLQVDRTADAVTIKLRFLASLSGLEGPLQTRYAAAGLLCSVRSVLPNTTHNGGGVVFTVVCVSTDLIKV